MSGKVVVNRCMSLDGFIAGPGHSMEWGDVRALADHGIECDGEDCRGGQGEPSRTEHALDVLTFCNRESRRDGDEVRASADNLTRPANPAEHVARGPGESDHSTSSQSAQRTLAD